MDHISTLFKEHWDTILITVLSIVIFLLVLNNKRKNPRR